METSDKINEIATAMNKLQEEMEFAVKDIQAFKYKYADLAQIWGILKEPLTKNGLMITQDAFSTNIGAGVQTMVVHAKSGQWIRSGVLSVPGGDKTAHGCGSSITYGKRYQLCALLAIQVDDDDDGRAAQEESKKVKKEPPKLPDIPPLNDDEISAFLEKWTEKYPLADLQDYCEARSKKLQRTTAQTFADLAFDEKLFVKSIDIWLAQNKEK